MTDCNRSLEVALSMGSMDVALLRVRQDVALARSVVHQCVVTENTPVAVGDGAALQFNDADNSAWLVLI